MSDAAFPEGRAVAGVLLAAGLSSRMGYPKLLARLGEWPLCRYAADALARGGHDYLLAVIPPGEVGEQVRAALEGLAFEFVVNPDPARGLGSSFRTAIQALPAGVAAANFALADMPLVTPEVHQALLGAFRQAYGAHQGCGCEPEVELPHETEVPLVLAEYGDGTEVVRAPPHLFRLDLLQAVLDAPDADHGPRQLIREHAHDGLVVRFPAELLLDVDTPDALLQAGAKLR